MQAALERFLVGGGVVRAAGHLRDLLQQLGVHVDLDRLVGGAAEEIGAGRVGHPAALADQDRVDLDADLFRDLRRLQRRDVACVVVAVGDEDDDAALRLRLAQAVDGGGERVPDRRAVDDHSRAHLLEQLFEHAIVQRQRTLSICLAGEHDETDAVVLARLDEALQHLFRDRDAERSNATTMSIPSTERS